MCVDRWGLSKDASQFSFDGASLPNPEYQSSVDNVAAACKYLNEVLKLTGTDLLRYVLMEGATVTREMMGLAPNMTVDNIVIFQEGRMLLGQFRGEAVATFQLAKTVPRNQSSLQSQRKLDQLGPQVHNSVSFIDIIQAILDNKEKIKNCPDIQSAIPVIEGHE